MLDQDLRELLNLPKELSPELVNNQIDLSSVDLEVGCISDKEIEEIINQIEELYKTVDPVIEDLVEERHSA